MRVSHGDLCKSDFPRFRDDILSYHQSNFVFTHRELIEVFPDGLMSVPVIDPFAQSEDPLDLASSEPYTRNQETTTYGKLVNEIQTFHIKVYPYYDDYLNIRSSAPAEEERPSTFISQDSHQLAAGVDFLVFPGQLFENFDSFESPSSPVSRQRYDSDDEKSYGDFKFIKPWSGASGGGGAFASFRRPPTSSTRLAVALKVSVRSINKSNNRPVVLGTFLKEIRVMGKLKSCPSVVDLLGIAFVEKEAEVRPTLIVELALGNAIDFFRSPTFAGSVTWELKSHFSLNIADALRALHAIDLIHADVKGKNVLIFLLNETGFCAKLSDFGNCVPTGSPPPRAPGTTVYLPPECLGPDETTLPTDSVSKWFGNAHYRDIYSFGLFVWELATDCEHDAPFRHSDIETKLKYDATGKGAAANHLLAFVPDSTPQHFRNIICGTLATIPTQRISLDDVIESLHSIVKWYVVPCTRVHVIGFAPSPAPSPSSSTVSKDSLSVDTNTTIDNSVVSRPAFTFIPVPYSFVQGWPATLDCYTLVVAETTL
jgi:serine/threonine protein kinase